jgi:hypothetical protein
LFMVLSQYGRYFSACVGKKRLKPADRTKKASGVSGFFQRTWLSHSAPLDFLSRIL